LWRTQRSYVTGSDDGHTARFGDTTSAFDPATGDLLSATQVVTSPQSYTFPGEVSVHGAALAFTQTDEDLVASTVYDAWGNALQSCAGHDLGGVEASTLHPPTECLRFGFVVYDAAYQQLAMDEHLAASRSIAGIETLDYEGTWDRG